MTTATATLTVNCTLSAEDFEDILDTAGYSIGYWARSASIETLPGASGEVLYRVTDDSSGQLFLIFRDHVQQAIASIIEDPSVENGNLAEIMLHRDYGEIDANLADLIIQFACFNEAIYG